MGITQRSRLYYVFTDFFNGTLLVYLPLFLKSYYGYSGSEFGTILFVAGIGAVIGILIGPYIVNVFKTEKSVLIIELSLMVLAIGLISLTSNYYLVILATSLCYLNRMSMYSIGDNMNADIAKEYGIPFSKFRSFGSIGWGLCFLINGFLVINYPRLFLLVWAIISMLAITNLFFLKERPKTEKQANLVDIKTVKEIGKYRNAVNYLLIATLLYIIIQTSSPFVNFLLLEVNGKVEIYSTITAVLVIIEFLVMYYAHVVRLKLKDQQYIELIAILIIIKMVLILVNNPIFIYLSAIVDPVIFGLILPFNPGYLKDSVPKKFNATVLSFFGIISLIAIALYTKIAGNIMDIFSTRLVFIIYLIMGILVFVLVKILKIKNYNR